MRRSQFDALSQPVRNLFTNPLCDTPAATTTFRTNIARNPSFETTSGTVDVRTNLFTNPAFDGVTGTTDVRTNWATNPSFEVTNGTINVRTNLSTNPSMESASSTVAVRTNLAVNPRMTNFNFGGYGAQTLSAVSTGVTGHPEQITTAVRTAYTAGAGNPGIVVMPLPDVNTQYTVSAWVYNEGPATETIAIALKGSSSGGSQDVPVGVWTRLAWTMTTPAALGSGNDFGVRISSPSATGSFLTTGVLIEKSPLLGTYFDGSTVLTNLTTNPTFETTTTGWNSVGGVPLTRDTSNPHMGTASMKVDTSGVGSSYVGAAQTLALAAGATYTISAYIWAPTGTTVNFAPDVIAVNTSVTGNSAWKRVSLTGVATGTGSFYIRSMAANQAAFWIDNVMVEKTSGLNPFYGPTADYTYSWSGTAHASTSFQQAPALATWGASIAGNSKIYQTQAGISGKSGVILKNGGYAFVNISLTGLQASTSYTMSYDILTTVASIVTVDRGVAGGAYTPASKTVTPNSVTRVNRTFTTGAGETTRLLSLAGWENADVADGTSLIIDNVLIEQGTLVQSYFDGATTAAGDFTYAWAGTANASLSYQQAPGVASWLNRWYGSTGGAGVLYQAKGGPSGTYARKLWTKANTGAAMDTGINTGNTTAWASTTYTLSAWVRSSVAQNFNFYIEWKDGAGTVIGATPQNTSVAVAANTWTRVSVTGTSPSTTGMAVFVIGPYAGAQPMPEGATLDFDNVLADMYPTLRDYFDTANPIKNYCTNPSFDTDTSGWTATSLVAGHGRSTARSWTGTASVWGVATDNIGDSMYTNTAAYDVDAEATYTVSAYVWVPTGVVAANFRESTRNLWAVSSANSTPSLVRGGNIDFTKTNQWQRVSVSITIPAGSNKLNVRLYFPANSLGVYWDAILVEKTENLNAYYAGLGGFTYVWSGAANTSYSLQQAPKPTAIGSANQAVTYQIGTSGNYKNRIAFTGTSITDSGINFAGGITTAVSKTYTASVTLTADVSRTFRFSAQGTGVVFSSSGVLNLPAGIPTRFSWTFSTNSTAGGSVALYILRADTLLGTIDVDKMLIEEGASQIGGYFDGTKVDSNLAPASNFETDATGWWPNTGTPTLSASTDRAYLGTKSLKAVSTVQTSDIAATFTVTLKPSTTYTMSYYVNSVDTRTSAYFDVAATNFNITRLGDTALVAGVWKRVSATFTTSDNIVGNTSFYLHQSGGPNVVGAIVYIDCVLLEESDKLNQYYEGAGDFTYAWTGTAHASTSVQRGVAISRVGSERAVAVSTTRNGDKVARIIPTIKGPGMAAYVGNDVFVNLYQQPASLKPNTTYTATVTYINEAPISVGGKLRFNIDGLDQYSAPFETTVGEYSMNWQFTTGGSGTMSFLRVMPGPSGVAGYTNEMILKNFMLIEGTYAGPYFDGTTAAGDYTYRWTGTAHDSTSELRAVPPLKVGWLNSIPATSTDWASSGTKSVRVSPAGASTDSFVYLTLPPLENGKTYTVMANLRMTAPQTGIPDVRARRIDVFHSNGYTLGEQAPNVAGVSKVRAVFKVTDKDAYTNVRLYNGASVGNGDVWYDNIMFVEGDYSGDFINPTQNPLSKWDGAANDSMSVGYPPQFFDLAGKPTKDIASLGASVVVANAKSSADMGPRTFYCIYEANGMTGNYNGLSYYGDSVSGGRVTFQTATANNNNMGIRLDFIDGEFNRVISFGGGRSNRRHVIAFTINDGITSFGGCLNGGADQTGTLNGGTGWNSDYNSLSVSSELVGLRVVTFYAEHDRATRVAISRYLGNKYGVYVA